MKRILLFIFIISTQSLQAQLYLDFEFYFDLYVDLDSNANNLWQVGAPQKNIFNSAFSPPNAIVTDLTNSYPVNANSSFVLPLSMDSSNWSWISAIEWNQLLDIESGKDGAVLEFSLDDSLWQNAFTSPYVYNFYGFQPENQDTLQDGTVAFSGTDSTWRNIWLCFDFWSTTVGDSIYLRYRFVSDSVDTGQEGWMIDNFLVHETWVHTITKTVIEEKSMNIFPNPTKGLVNIELLQDAKVKEIQEIKVIDAMTKVVETFHGLPPSTTIDISHLPKGAYFIQIRTDVSTESHRLLLLPE